MNVTGLAANASTLVGGFALAGLLGLGLGSAAAAPGGNRSSGPLKGWTGRNRASGPKTANRPPRTRPIQ